MPTRPIPIISAANEVLLSQATANEKFFRLLSRRERWGFTIRGWLVALGVFLCLAVATVLAAYPFLAVTSPTKSDSLVVEGWISQRAISLAAEHINSNHYSRVFVTGGPRGGPGETDAGNYATQGYSRLKKRGISEPLLMAIPSERHDRDRTFGEAVALQHWCKQNAVELHSLNLLSEAVHSRRSRLLFQKALGPDVQVGIIALPPRDYPADRWWKFSAGVKEVITEAVGYFYVRLFFWPEFTGES